MASKVQSNNSRQEITSRVLYLSQCEAFSSLASVELEKIALLVNVNRFSTKQVIIREGDHSSDVYFVAVGSVRTATVSSDGKEIYYQDLKAGKMFGELSAIDKFPRTTSVEALEDTVTLSMNSADFIQLMECYKEVNEFVMRKLVALVRFLCDRVYQFRALNVQSRVRLELLSLAEMNAESSDSTDVIIEAMPKHETIANRIATHREAVTRELKELKKLGVLTTKRGKAAKINLLRLRDLLATAS